MLFHSPSNNNQGNVMNTAVWLACFQTDYKNTASNQGTRNSGIPFLFGIRMKVY